MAKNAKAPLTPEQVEVKAIKKKKRGENTIKFFAVLLAAVLTFGVFSSGKKVGVKVAEEAAAKAAETDTNNTSDEGDSDEVDFGGDEEGDASTDDSSKDDASTDDSSKDDASTGDKTTDNKTEAKLSNAEIAKIVNDATAKAVNAKAGYDWTRKAAYTKDGAINVKMFGGDATKELNKVIQGVAPESDLSTVVANFIGIGQTNANCPKGSAKLIHSDGEYKGDEVWEHQNYLLKATTFKEGDFKVAQKKGDLYQIQLNSCTNPQKNDGSALANATNDFLTQDEANASIKNGLGGKDIVKIKSSTVDFTKIAFVAEIKDGTLKNLTISYTFSVDLQLNLLKITGSGKATTEMTYSNFVY